MSQSMLPAGRAPRRPEWTTEILVSEREDDEEDSEMPLNDRTISFRKVTADKDINNTEEDEDGSSDISPADDGISTSSRIQRTSSLAKNDDKVYFADDINRRVRLLKILTFALLFLVAVAVCLAVFLVTKNGQQDEFEAAFTGDGVNVIKSFEEILRQRIGAVASFGVTMTSFTNHMKMHSWPYVTMNDFQERSASARSLSGAIFMEVVPIVQAQDLEAWGNYTMMKKGWLDEGRVFQQEQGIPLELNQYIGGESPILPFVWTFGADGMPTPANGSGPFYPIWQQSPVVPGDLVNLNIAVVPELGPFIELAAQAGEITIGGLLTAPPGDITSDDFLGRSFSQYLSFEEKEVTPYNGEPISSVVVPIMDSLKADRKPVAVLLSLIKWSKYFEDILGPTAQPLHVVLANNCQETSYTYLIDGEDVVFQGEGNRASKKFDDLMMSIVVDEDSVVIEKDTIKLKLNQDICRYTLQVYPTEEEHAYYNDNFPLTISLVIAAVFLFTVIVFVAYDYLVEQRQRKILDTAKRSTAIVSSIFPKNIRDKLMHEEAPVQGNATKLRTLANLKRPGSGTDFEREPSEDDEDLIATSQPIADLFPDCTVMFADIEGFTAWSSVREPSQVFTLLESLYATMDRIATRRKVFKVETVGDCYVAVCGLPESRKDNASVMARFARDCIEQHIVMVKKLERTLGPDTGELRLRVGLNSGPITAGVLRGRGSRFQLFGDTVNTCARMESSGNGNRIHVSEHTAKLLIEAGHEDWVKVRPDVVNLKGKGEMTTYWVNPLRQRRDLEGNSSSEASLTSFDGNNSVGSLGSSDTLGSLDSGDVNFSLKNKKKRNKNPELKKRRLITWNVELLVKAIKQIVAHREETDKKASLEWKTNGESSTPLDEVVEIIELPQHSNGVGGVSGIKLDMDITQLVFEFVGELAAMYKNNPFHNFEHASHVTMSVSKLMSRIVAPSDMNFSSNEQAFKKLHDHTYGITSDPLTHFACIFSAMIHDADHQGVPNTTLVQEEAPIAATYHGKSVAEQNSVDKAWNLLMSDNYKPLVATLCRDETELKRLRQLVVNSVMATDIMDPDLKKLRNDRWDKAFKGACDQEDANGQAINRKATIVIEHLIQASDVSHTMQHWSVYTKWNACLFKEMYKAYLDGRSGAKDPSEFWAKGEIGFFDFYIIPLARKLKECGVFGVSSDEYLNYAISNRNEWEAKGESIVKDLVAKVHEEYGQKETK